MAIYYIKVQVIGRSAGRTATGAAAYRAGERIEDERTGQVFDYTRRRGEIETEILAPQGAPEWVYDREALWNRVEAAERRADAQVAREIVVAFPKELTPGEQRDLIHEYVQEQFVSRGMVADVAIHRNPGNPHAHIMLTMREIGPEGFSAKKNREWNKPEMLEQWRERWATHANHALEKAGREERIDHRSLAEQGSERLPQVHLGPHASALERQGVQTEKGDHNRLVQEHNAVVIDFAHAQEEKRQLQAEKVVLERYETRLQAGWLIPHAQALGQLEYRQGGAQMTSEQVVGLEQQQKQELLETKMQLLEIRSEERRLAQAEEYLAYLKEAEAHLSKLQAPIPTIKRVFSQQAKQEYRETRARVQRFDESTRSVGVASDGELAEQRTKWERKKARVPELEEKVERIGRNMERIKQALTGFELEHVRELERRLERMQERGRGGIDRGR